MSLRGDPMKLRELRRLLQALPMVTGQRVAARVAPMLTAYARGAYLSNQTVYGDTRPDGVHGALDLVESGNTLDRMRFVANGTIVRAVLPKPYTRYLVGKYRILPMGKLPVSWSQAIRETTIAAIREELAQ